MANTLPLPMALALPLLHAGTPCTQVTGEAAMAMAKRLIKEEGILAGISSGVWGEEGNLASMSSGEWGGAS